MILFEGLRFRRPGKRDPKSCLAHHLRSFDRDDEKKRAAKNALHTLIN